jgi:hypothetical protein
MRRSTRRWLASVAACLSLAAPFVASPALAAEANYQGLWWNRPAESGWGINFAHQGDVIFATWFTYNSRSEPWWLIAELHRTLLGGTPATCGPCRGRRSTRFRSTPPASPRRQWGG